MGDHSRPEIPDERLGVEPRKRKHMGPLKGGLFHIEHSQHCVILEQYL
jgi:hypothetical protein